MFLAPILPIYLRIKPLVSFFLVRFEQKRNEQRHWARPCEKTGPKNQWFKPVVSENKSLVRKKIITGLKKLTSDFWDIAKISLKTTG